MLCCLAFNISLSSTVAGGRMSPTVIVMATEKFTVILYDKSGQQTIPFLIISLFKTLLVLVTGKKQVILNH